MEALIQSELLVACFSSVGFVASFCVGSFVAFKETVDLYRRRKAARLIRNDKLQKIMEEAKQIALEKFRIQALENDEISAEQEMHEELHATGPLVADPALATKQA